MPMVWIMATSRRGPVTATLPVMVEPPSVVGKSLTLEAKRKILGGNAAKLYGIDINAHKALLDQENVEGL